MDSEPSSNTPIYTRTPDNEKSRYDSLIKKFSDDYEIKPDCIIRAPGRVNLIGEHIDYSGYAVLPMAIDHDILIAVKYSSDDRLQIANVDDKHCPHVCGLSEMTFDPPMQWYRYVFCGVRAILDICKDPGNEQTFQDGNQQFHGARLMVCGRVPLASGLSSSSALVCCSTLMAAHGVGMTLNKTRLAEISTYCEQYIGVQGGGMDQAISMLAIEGMAKLVEFKPLRSHDVKLPGTAAFVIANTCVESCKAVGSQYNSRVMECKLAAKLLVIGCGGKPGDVDVLIDFDTWLNDLRPRTADDLLRMADLHLHPEPYAVQELLDILEVDLPQFQQLYPAYRSGQKLELHRRAKHVFSEQRRVYEFQRMCDEASGEPGLSSAAAGQGEGQGASRLQNLGRLMDASHDSCNKDFDCSCEELNELVQVARNAGAMGSRLTGAGWGGCTVSLVAIESVDEFLDDLRKHYYNKTDYRKSRCSESVFVSKPGGGACIYKL